jgi:exonuclease III
MTRYEITEEFTDGVKVKLPTGQAAYVFNLHLPSHPYQPYQLLNIRPSWHKHTNDIVFIKTEAEAIEWAQKTRGDLIEALFEQIDSISDKEAPVFVVGDFNEPSHLDWTEAAAQAGRHPIKVAYPASQALAQAGFTDAYRALYPDEMTHPGLTWTPTKTADDPTTHLDRIDFVYSKGVSPKAVQIVGEKGENANIVISPYPSDHRAIVATYDLP